MIDKTVQSFDNNIMTYAIPNFQATNLIGNKNIFSILLNYSKQSLHNFPKILKKNWLTITIVGIISIISGLLFQFNLIPKFLMPFLYFIGGKLETQNPNLIQVIGGIVSKGIILTFIIGIKNMIKNKKPLKFSFLSNYFSKYSHSFKNLKNIASITLGAGFSFLIHAFLSTDGKFINSFASLIMIFYMIKAASNQSGVLRSLGYRSFKKTPVLLDELFRGIVGGLALVLPLSLILKVPNIFYYLSLGLIVIGIVLFMINIFISNKKNNQLVLFLALTFMLPLAFFSSTSNVYAASAPVELIIPDSVISFEQFDLKIKINSNEIKKYKGEFIIDTTDNAYIGLRILSGPPRDNEGNYNGESELNFKVQFTTDITELTKITFKVELWIDISKYVLTIYKSTTLVPVELSVELPTSYNFTKTSFDPFNGYYAKAEFNGGHEWYDFRIAYKLIDSEYWAGREYYEPINGPIKPFFDYNSTLHNTLLDRTKNSVSQEVLDYFKAESGYYMIYKKSTPYSTNPPVYDSLVQIGMVLFRGITTVEIYLDHSLSNASFDTTSILDQKEQEFYSIIKSIYLKPKVASVPTYPQQIEIQSDYKNVITDNTVVAGVGAIVVVLATALFSSGAGTLLSSFLATDSEIIKEKLEDKRKREYQLIIKKNINGKLKFEQKVTLEAAIQERIYEDNGSFSENINPTLTDLITFSSVDGFVEFSQSYLLNDFKTINFVAHHDEKIKQKPKNLTITCTIISANGSHQQNVIFQIMGEPLIELKDTSCNILAFSNRKFTFPFTLVDFLEKPIVTVSAWENNIPFEISIEKNETGEEMIAVIEMSPKKAFNSFFEVFHCTIKAENQKEKAETNFDVTLCFEGILPDFLGKPSEISAFYKDIEKEEMAETIFAVKSGIWNDYGQCLELHKPENVKITLFDESHIFVLIKIDVTEDKDRSTGDTLVFVAKAQKCFPSMDSIDGKMLIQGNYGSVSLENEVDIKLIPDKLQYEQDYEKEYQACKRVIEVYMAKRYQDKKLKELEKAKKNLGIEDFRLFRQKCWRIAEQSIKQEGQDYILEAAWYDEAIANLELIVYVGDIAFDIALSPIGGPIVGFLASQVKSSLLELWENWPDESSDQSTWDFIFGFVQSRLTQGAGQLDGLIKMPDPSSPKELTIWLTCFVIYRIGYHLCFTKEDGKPIGISESIKKGLLDFVGKGVGVLLGDYIKKISKGHWTEKVSVTEKDEDIVNKNVSKVMKTSLDSLDQVAKKADQNIDDFINTLKNYIEQLKA